MYISHNILPEKTFVELHYFDKTILSYIRPAVVFTQVNCLIFQFHSYISRVLNVIEKEHTNRLFIEKRILENIIITRTESFHNGEMDNVTHDNYIALCILIIENDSFWSNFDFYSNNHFNQRN